MIIDKLLEFSSAQALTATAASTSDLDLKAAGDAMDGSELYLVVRCGTLLDSSGEGATLKIALQCDSDSAFGSVKELAALTLAEAAIAADSILWMIKIPVGCERYVRLYYTVSGENFTGGTIDAFLTANVDKLFV
jgi:hypothetical protein